MLFLMKTILFVLCGLLTPNHADYVHLSERRVPLVEAVPSVGIVRDICSQTRDDEQSCNLGQNYNSSVDVSQEDLFRYVYTESPNKTTALRVQVTAMDADEEYPVLFVVRQQRQILSWQVPLMLETLEFDEDVTYSYHKVDRTLCPMESDMKHPEPMKQTVLIDVSTARTTPQSYTLRVDSLSEFELDTNQKKTVKITPSQPSYYEYTFPEGIDSVVVHFESNNQLCMVASIQSTACPVFDLVRNVEFTGEFQTVTKQGAITLQKSTYKKGSFYVVLVLRPSDYECLGIESLIPSKGQSAPTRQKEVTFWVEPSISKDQYLAGVLGAVAWFLVFYVIALVIAFIYHITDSSADIFVPAPDAERASASEYDPLVSDNTSPLTNPLAADGTSGSHGYGTVPSTSRGISITSPTIEGERSSNGIPHRIRPPADDSDASPEDEYDLLDDADQDKDIFRTKTFLYVADLARKDKKTLKKKYKLYHWNLMTIAIFYGLPVIQLVITYQQVLHVTGDEDICYYNFLCAHPLGVLSAFNNVFSNIGYVMLGLLFLILVFRRDIMYRRMVCRNDAIEKSLGIPQHFGLYYAAGIALMMEGVLSGCYHVCPSYSNFQFDTAFMYMIGWLLMLKIYQTRHPDINPQAYVAYFAISIVIMLAVIGVVYGNVYFWIFFSALHVFTTLVLSVQIYYMGRWRLDLGVFHRLFLWCKSDVLRCTKPMYTDRMVLLVIVNVVNWSIAMYGMVIEPKDFASYLLSIFIINLLMYYAFYIIMKIRSGERILPVPIVFIILAAFVWGCAFYFFLAKLTSWQVTPALSREGNKPCLLLGFYDNHDIWHGLSAMALFLSFMTLINLDDDLLYTPRDRIPVF